MEMITVLNTVILLYSQLGQAPPLPLLTQRECSVHSQGYPEPVSSGEGACFLWRPEGTDVSQRPTVPKEEQRPGSNRGAQDLPPE